MFVYIVCFVEVLCVWYLIRFYFILFAVEVKDDGDRRNRAKIKRKRKKHEEQLWILFISVGGWLNGMFYNCMHWIVAAIKACENDKCIQCMFGSLVRRSVYFMLSVFCVFVCIFFVSTLLVYAFVSMCLQIYMDFCLCCVLYVLCLLVCPMLVMVCVCVCVCLLFAMIFLDPYLNATIFSNQHRPNVGIARL